MRTLKFVLAFLIAIAIGVFCFANSADVTVRVWPDLTDYGVAASPSVMIPLFVVALLAGLVGFLLGAAREWMRESRIRSTGRHAKREAAALKAKVDDLTRDREDDAPALPAR